MKNEKLILFTRIGWACALLAAWAFRAWNSDGSIIGIVIVICGWSSVRIISEGIIASSLIMKANDEDIDEEQ